MGLGPPFTTLTELNSVKPVPSKWRKMRTTSHLSLENHVLCHVTIFGIEQFPNERIDISSTQKELLLSIIFKENKQQYKWAYSSFQMTLHAFRFSSGKHFKRFYRFADRPRLIDIVGFKISMQVSSFLRFPCQFVAGSVLSVLTSQTAHEKTPSTSVPRYVDVL